MGWDGIGRDWIGGVLDGSHEKKKVNRPGEGGREGGRGYGGAGRR